MNDRIANKPNRRLVTPEGGGTPYYAYITRADEPIEEGTPNNKANLCADETGIRYGLYGDKATVNNVFNVIYERIPASYYGAISIKAYDPNGNPIQGLLMQGIAGAAQSVTNQYGELLFYVTTPDAVTITPGEVVGYARPNAVTITPEIGRTVDITFQYTYAPAGYVHGFDISQTVMFADRVKSIDLFLLGGGENTTANASSSGAGGRRYEELGLSNLPESAVVNIGAAGAAGANGDSAFLGRTTVGGLFASGVTGGTGVNGVLPWGLTAEVPNYPRGMGGYATSTTSGLGYGGSGARTTNASASRTPATGYGNGAYSSPSTGGGFGTPGICFVRIASLKEGV